MQTPIEISENRAMHGIAVALLTEDREHLSTLQNRLEATRLGTTVFTHVGFPNGPTDAILRQLQDSRSEVVIVDIAPQDAQRAIRAIELIRSTTQQIAIFANGEMSQPAAIVNSMRAGATEYLDHLAGHEPLLEALTRFSSSRTRSLGGAGKARVFTFLSAKGGAGCTTAAVNTALALQQLHGDVVLLDFAPIGHAALHLNLRPQFGVLDALQNLHRMDVSLLDGLMTPAKEGMHLLAGPSQPYPTEPTPGELARLFDLLVNHYRFVVVDASSRLDPTTRLLSDLSNAVLVVAQTDVVSLWSAGRIHAFLEEGTGRDRLRMVLNRYKKIPGFTDEDVQQVTNCKVLWKVPNAYHTVSPAIDHGTPVVLQEGSEISRSYRALAETLAEASSNSDGSPDLIYGHEGSRKKAPGRLSLSPIRAGQ
ncbi:MAG TPA: cellulose synthase operon protein YhjQ/BcsQ [Candidatus Sulfotelmatobacter sp.]|jgi:pilus assembly protein CpaE|nr:cellulose synthase operon protein YhjQ/BcsQ [Candidatus Sulfotelmatobacter sp.]